MGTLYSTIIDAFKTRAEEDINFFNYVNLYPEEAELIIQLRCSNFLNEAIAYLCLKTSPTVDFYDKDDVNEQFNFELTGKEIQLFAYIMYQQYMFRDVAKLKCLDVNYTATDLRVFDPSNARSTFNELYKTICEQNNVLIDAYASQNRDTGKYLGIDFLSYEENE